MLDPHRPGGGVGAVVVVRWPEEARQLETLARDGVPRLLLVAPDAEPPDESDCSVDWVRLPATDADVRARVKVLEERAARHANRDLPHGDGRGRFFFRDRWVSLSPHEEALANELARRFGDVVDATTLVRTAWPDARRGSAGALRVHLVRLRRRLGPLGLGIRNVRDRGYVLYEKEASFEDA